LVKDELFASHQRIEQLEAHSNELDLTIERLKDTILIKDEDIRAIKEEHH
jgi:hypothetical protein